MRWVVLIAVAVTTSLHADTPWVTNTRVSTDVPWDTLNQGESCFDVYGDSLFSVCNTAERASVPIAPYSYSFDEGTSFTQIPFTDNTTGVIWHTDPVIGVDDSGHVHMLIQYSLNFIRHYLSRDGGLTWSDTTRVTPYYGVDKPWMVVNKNEIYVVWQQTDGQVGIWFAKSTDYGASFSARRIWERRYITALCMDENENLHLALVDWTTGDNIYYRKSTDKGDTWLPEVYLSDWDYVESYGDRAPINSIAARGDVVFVTWVDTRYGGWDVMGVRSTDGGATWGTPFVVNDLTEGGQCKGWSHFDRHGGLHVVYYHTPDWPTSVNSQFSFHSQYSPDSGATFYPSVRVSDVSFRSHADFMGEYHICVSDSLYLYAIWTDGRNGDDNDLYFSKALLSDLAIRVPEISLYDYEWEDSGDDSHADPGDTLSLTISLLNSGGDALVVTANLSSSDTSVTVLDSSSSYGEILTDSVKTNAGDPFILFVDPSAHTHACTLSLAVVADSVYVFSETVVIMIGTPDILLIDDDGGDSYETYFIESLHRVGLLFDLRGSEENISSSFMSDYEALVWLTGDNPSPVDSTDASALSDYLDSGGNLLITGQDVEGCSDTIFYQDYLHAEVAEDSADRSRVFGFDNDPIGDGLRFFIGGAPGAANQTSPSIITPIGGADSVFDYQSGGCCGLKYGGTYKVVYLSFGFEAVNPLSAADTLMLRILKWFGLPVSIEEPIARQEIPSDIHYLRTHPNPFGEALQIEYFVATPSELELRIYDAAGRIARTLIQDRRDPGVYRIGWDGRDDEGSKVPSGVYLCRMAIRPLGSSDAVPESDGFTSTTKMILLR